MSSTRDDLVQERREVNQVIDRLRVTEFVGMERFGARPSSPVEASESEVDSVDVYVGIIGTRHGEVTELEFRRAYKRGVPCYFFIKATTDREAALERWLYEIRDKTRGWIVEEFTSASGLATSLAAVLTNHIIADWTAGELVAAVRRGDADRIAALLRTAPATDVIRRLLARRGVDAGDDLLLDLTRRAQTVRPAEIDPRMMRASVDNFVRWYLGRPNDPVPFGGRGAEVAWLHEWVRDDSRAPYLLVAEEAGRGKSALLVHFLHELFDDPSLTVVFLPISVRFGLNLAAVVFPALATQLANIHGAPLPTNMNAPVRAWQELTLDYLSRPLPNGRKLVLVLDGLDEAADWTVEPELFPANPPRTLRIIASARLVVEASNAAEWRRLLGWENPHLAESRGLDPLGPNELRDVIIRMGVPVAELASRPEIVTQLLRLTGGDPLLVSLYVRELWSKGDEAPFLQAEQLESMTPGFAGFFKRWWHEQLKLWGSDAPLWQKGVRRLLNVFCMTHGRLRRDDLLTLLGNHIDDVSGLTLDLLLKPLRRFVVGDSNGYTFNHPLYARYLREQMLLPIERQRCEAELIAWGQSVLRLLEEGALHARDAPPYVVQYLSTHLGHAGAPADEFLRLLSASWRSAWEAVGGGLSGFAAEVARTLEALAKEPGRLDDEIYCATLLASIRSLAQNIPPSLLTRLVEEGQWTRASALAYVRAMADSSKKAEALVLVGRLFDGAERELIDAEALDIEGRVRAPSHEISFDVLLGCTKLPISRIHQALSETDSDGKMRCFRRLAADGRQSDLIALALRFRGARRMDVLTIAATAMLERRWAREAYPLFKAMDEASWLSEDLIGVLLLTALDVLPRLAPVLSQRWPNLALAIRRHLPRIADLSEAIGRGLSPEWRGQDIAWVSLLLMHYRHAPSPPILRVLERLRPCIEQSLATGISSRLLPHDLGAVAAPLMAFASDDERKDLLYRLIASREQYRLLDCVPFIADVDLPAVVSFLGESTQLVAALAKAGRPESARMLAECELDDLERFHSLARILPHLADQQRREVTDAILEELDTDEELFDYGREQLEQLISALQPDQLVRAVSIARRIEDGSAQRAVRIGLRGILPVRERSQWLQDVMNPEADHPYGVMTGLLLPPDSVAEIVSWVATTVDTFELHDLLSELLLLLRSVFDPIAAAPLAHVVERTGPQDPALSWFGRPLPPQLVDVTGEPGWELNNLPACLWFLSPARRERAARAAFRTGIDEEHGYGAQRSLAPFLSRDLLNALFRHTLELFPGAPDLEYDWSYELDTAMAILAPVLAPDQMDELLAHVRQMNTKMRISAALQILPFANVEQRQALRILLESESPDELCWMIVFKFSHYLPGDLPQQQIVDAMRLASIRVDPVRLTRATQERPAEDATIVLAHCQPLLALANVDEIREVIALMINPRRNCLRDRLLLDVAALRQSITMVYGPEMCDKALEAIERACRIFP